MSTHIIKLLNINKQIASRMSSLNFNSKCSLTTTAIVIFTLPLLTLLLLLLVSGMDCLKIERVDGPATTSLSTGWRTVEVSGVGAEGERDDSSRPKRRNSTTVAPSERDKKLVEWDDDDLNDFLQNIRDQEKNGGDLQDLDLQSLARSGANVNRPRKSSKFSRLVYHGQVKQNSTTIKLRDGLKIHIDTHRPLAIYRRSQQKQQQRPKLANAVDSTSEQPSTVVADSHWSVESSGDLQSPVNSISSSSSSELVRSSSDWRPIVMTAALRSRRSGKTSLADATRIGGKSPTNPNSSNTTTTTKNPRFFEKLSESSGLRWKPIVSEAKSLKLRVDEVAKKTEDRGDISRIIPKKNGDVVYGKVSLEENSRTISARIEEPFEDEGLIVLRNQMSVKTTGQRSPKSHKLLAPKENPENTSYVRRKDDNRWTPVDSTTTRAATVIDDLATTTAATTSISTTTATHASSNGSMELAAHRSASDLNYIYSSQPDTLSSRSSGSSSYYSNYLLPAQQVAQPIVDQQAGAIIDTTSGQLPEMIAERAPDLPPAPVYENSGYSMPQTSVSAFQPAQPLPPRQPVLQPAMASYGAYSDYGPPRVQQQPQQAVRAQQPAPQVVKQEHHYHYYNQQQQQREQQQQQQQPDRQMIIQQAQQPTSQIIREIQPMLIVQQSVPTTTTTTTTTTPAPQQIIREIIRETPMQPPSTPQFSRLIQLPPQPVVRELEPPTAVQYTIDTNPAQRIIRQLSSSLPSVSMRMPQLAPLPPIRLPAFQLPIRLGPSGSAASNQPPVTRQTGSFVIPPMPKKTTTYLTETQAMPTHTTIMHTTQFTPATRTTVFTTDHDTTSSRALPAAAAAGATGGYKAKK